MRYVRRRREVKVVGCCLLLATADLDALACEKVVCALEIVMEERLFRHRGAKISHHVGAALSQWKRSRLRLNKSWLLDEELTERLKLQTRLELLAVTVTLVTFSQ